MKEHLQHTHYAEALAQRFQQGMLEELQDYDQFVVWRKTSDNKKIPYTPNTGLYARTDAPETWTNLDSALQALRKGCYDGIGFVFSDEDNFTGVDIDHSIQNGQLTPQAQELVTKFWSYTELSPSGTGLHILIEGEVPEGRRKDGIEMYSSKRFFTITTRHLKGSPETIEPRQRELDKLYTSLTALEPRTETFKPKEYQVFISNEKVLETAFNAKNGADIQRLYSGDISGFQSKSHADWQLILYLLHYTNNDVDQVKRLFLQSNLVDEKTLSRRGDSTYLDVTVSNAMRKKYN